MMNETGIGQRERDVLQKAKWDMLRSDIYIRDKGICWVCNEKVELRDYDLGHLVDRCNGGQDEYDNLAVMHKHCNTSKPRHTTLEEALKWKLTSQYLTVRPMAKKTPPKEQLSFITTNQPQQTLMAQPTIRRPITPNININDLRQIPDLGRLTHNESLETPQYIVTKTNAGNTTFYKKETELSKEDKDAARQLILEYFTNRPELLGDWSSLNRREAIRQISSTLNIDEHSVTEFVKTLINKINPPIETLNLENVPEQLKDDTGHLKQGILEWRMGMNWVVLPPREDDSYHVTDIQHLDKPLPGTRQFAVGRGSSQKTLQILGGTLKKDADINLGWLHVHISGQGDKPKIEFLGGKNAADTRWNNQQISEPKDGKPTNGKPTIWP